MYRKKDNQAVKCVIIGSSGMLGSYLRSTMPGAVGISRSRSRSTDLIVSDYFSELPLILDKLSADVIINCAAITNLSYCEANQREAHHAHVGLNALLAGRKERTILISTDSVFNGFDCPVDGYLETHSPDPLNYYARSKLEGEKPIISTSGVVVRTNIYGQNISKPSNSLYAWALKNCLHDNSIVGFTDVFFNPVSLAQLGISLELIIRDPEISGLLNICSSNRLSKYEFIKRIYLGKKRDVDLVLPSLAMSGDGLQRPKCTVLNNSLSIDLGFPEFSLSDGLAQTLAFQW